MHCAAVAARVGGVGHRHRLDDDRRAAADLDATDFHAHRLVELQLHRRSHVARRTPAGSRHEAARASAEFLMIAFGHMSAIVVREFGAPT